MVLLNACHHLQWVSLGLGGCEGVVALRTIVLGLGTHLVVKGLSQRVRSGDQLEVLDRRYPR